jgi:hypothetical protein
MEVKIWHEDDDLKDEEYTLSFLVSTIAISSTSQGALFLNLSSLLLPRRVTLQHLLITLSPISARHSWYVRV